MGTIAISGAAVQGVSVHETLNWRILSKGRITTRSSGHSGRESREWVGVGKWRYEEKNIAVLDRSPRCAVDELALPSSQAIAALLAEARVRVPGGGAVDVAEIAGSVLLGLRARTPASLEFRIAASVNPLPSPSPPAAFSVRTMAHAAAATSPSVRWRACRSERSQGARRVPTPGA